MDVKLELRHIYHIKRKEKKISMSKMASYIPCSQSMISRFETGDCDFSERKLKRYMEFIDTY